MPSIVMTEPTTVTLDGRPLELIEDVPTGLTVTAGVNDITFSMAATDTTDGIYTERYTVTGDDEYGMQVYEHGLQRFTGLTAPAGFE